ncbi:MAG: galactokinase [Spirochaetota bacterium]
MYEKLLRAINEHYGESEYAIRLFTAPGRINLIGEHVDYLGGKVLPAAIDFKISCAVRKNDLKQFRVYSFQYNSSLCKKQLMKDPTNPWINYILGVISELEKKGFSIGGFDMALDGNIPEGAGLSSSAALEVVVAYALAEIFQFPLDKTEIALLAQAAENNFVGLNCGIMDQFVIAHGKAGHALILDTAKLAFEYVPFTTEGYITYLIQSNVKHSLQDSSYNHRIEECNSALQKVQNNFPEVLDLYSLPENFAVDSASLTGTEKKRVKHVIGERKRTDLVLQAMQEGDIPTVGECLYATHESLANHYEVSCPETDYLVAILKELGVLGARMIGGGFGGCILVIESPLTAKETQERIQLAYQEKFALEASIYEFTTSDGVKELA